MRQQSHNPRDNHAVIPGSGEDLLSQCLPCSRNGCSRALLAQSRSPCTYKVKPQLPFNSRAFAYTQAALFRPHHTCVRLSGHAIEASRRRPERLQGTNSCLTTLARLSAESKAIKIEFFARQAHAGICLLQRWQNSCSKHSMPSARDLQSQRRGSWLPPSS